MTIEELYNYFDQNWVTVSRELKFGSTTIYNWRRKGFIHANAQVRIEKKTNGGLKARIEDAETPEGYEFI